GRMLDGEPVPDCRLLAAVERELPGELAQVGLRGRGRVRLPEPDPDVAVGGYRDVIVDADPCAALAVVLHGYLVADVDGAGAADAGLAGAPAAQLAFHPDLVIHAELQLELLARGHGRQGRLPDELGPVEDPGRAGQEQQRRGVGDGRPQVGLRGEHRHREVVERGVEAEPADAGRAAWWPGPAPRRASPPRSAGSPRLGS